MKAAEIAQTGTPRQLYEAPESVFVATFMGEANRVAARITEVAGDQAMVDFGGVALKLPARGLIPGPVDLILRPEAIRLVAAGSASSLAATVKTATYMGAFAEYNLDTPVGALFAVSPDPHRLRAVGEPVGVAVAERGVFVVKP